jgi:ABC-type sugar transport system ATPase subunit
VVLFYSSDLDELMMLPDKVLVFYDGAIVDTVTRDQAEADRLVSSMLGRKAGT